MLIRTRSEKEIESNLVNSNKDRNSFRTGKRISLQFSHFFNGYTQAINKQNNRTGKLFELPFRRIPIENDAYFSRLIYYIHVNPQRHGLIDDFREYTHSSYHAHLSEKRTQLSRNQVIDWFGGRKSFRVFHDSFQDERKINSIVFDGF